MTDFSKHVDIALVHMKTAMDAIRRDAGSDAAAAAAIAIGAALGSIVTAVPESMNIFVESLSHSCARAGEIKKKMDIEDISRN